MKISYTYSMVFGALLIFGCKKDESENPIACIDAKIEAFMQDPSAKSIIKIDKPGDTLYWFEDVYGDGVEEVLNEFCELVCITDCECTGDFVFCDDTHLDFPKEVIWQK